MYKVYLLSISIIEHLQSVLLPFERIILILSHAGDPKNAFSFYFPLVFGLSENTGKRLLFGAVAGEWFNIIFKWVLFGERPYWWVKEHNITSPIRQFELTCETGPGSPSGHVMVTCVVFFIMLEALNEQLHRRFKYWFPAAIFIAMIFAVGVSRIFIAAHFPHQVVFGVFAAYIITEVLHKASERKYSLYSYTEMSLFLLCSAIGFNFLLQAVGIDLNWSVELAFKHCADQSWLGLNSTPFNSIVRVSAAFWGFGFSEEYLNKNSNLQHISSSYVHKFITVLFNLSVGILFDSFPMPATAGFFYICSAIKYILMIVTICHIVPRILSVVFNAVGKLKKTT